MRVSANNRRIRPLATTLKAASCAITRSLCCCANWPDNEVSRADAKSSFSPRLPRSSAGIDPKTSWWVERAPAEATEFRRHCAPARICSPENPTPSSRR